IEQGDLAEVRLAFAQRLRVGALIGDDAAAGAGDHARARQFARSDVAVARVVVGNAAGPVLDHVLGLELPELAGLEQVFEFLLAGAGHRKAPEGQSSGEWGGAQVCGAVVVGAAPACVPAALAAANAASAASISARFCAVTAAPHS